MQKPWEPETADFCTTRPQWRHCSQSEVVEVEFALCQSQSTQLGESPETAFAGLFRKGRGKVRLSTVTAEEKRELVRAEQSEISNIMKHATVQAATRSGVHSTALMRMRWVITQKPDPSQKARLVVLEFTRAQLGATPTASPTVSRRGRQFQDHKASECSKPMLRRPFCRGQLKIKNCTFNGLQNCHKRWAWNTTNAYNCEDRCTG